MIKKILMDPSLYGWSMIICLPAIIPIAFFNNAISLIILLCVIFILAVLTLLFSMIEKHQEPEDGTLKIGKYIYPLNHDDIHVRINREGILVNDKFIKPDLPTISKVNIEITEG